MLSKPEFDQLVLTPEEREKYKTAKLRFKKTLAYKHLSLTGTVSIIMLVLFFISGGMNIVDSGLCHLWIFRYTRTIFITITIFFLCLNIPSIITIIKSRKIKINDASDPKDIYVNDIVSPIVHRKYPKAIVSTECNFNPKQLCSKGILPRYDRCEQYFHIADFNENKEWQFTAENIKLIKTDYDPDTKTYIDSEILFNGQVYAIPFKSYIDGNVIILTSYKLFGREHTYQDNPLNKLQKIDIEDIEFNDNFEVYANNETDAFYVLNPSTIEVLKALKCEYPQFGIHVRGDMFFISINSGHQLFSPPSSGYKIDALDLNEEYIMMQRLSYFCRQIRDGINAKTFP